MTEKEFEKVLDMKLNEVIAYAVGGECGGRTLEDCKKELKDFMLKEKK